MVLVFSGWHNSARNWDNSANHFFKVSIPVFLLTYLIYLFVASVLWMIDLPFLGACPCLNRLFILQRNTGIWCCWEVYLGDAKCCSIFQHESVDALLYSSKWSNSRVYSLYQIFLYQIVYGSLSWYIAYRVGNLSSKVSPLSFSLLYFETAMNSMHLPWSVFNSTSVGFADFWVDELPRNHCRALD